MGGWQGQSIKPGKKITCRPLQYVISWTNYCAVLCLGVVVMCVVIVCAFFCIYALPGPLLFQLGTLESGPPFSLVYCHTFMTLSSSRGQESSLRDTKLYLLKK